MCQSFGTMGLAKAEAEINAHEQDSASAVSSEIKPFTTKAPTHVIEGLDLLAGHFGMTRNALVLKLINQYLGQAFAEYSTGYNSVFHMLCAPFVFNSLYVFTMIIAEMIKVKISDTGIE